jgi:hypothetical protein
MIQYGRWKKYVSYSILMMLEVGVNIIETKNQKNSKVN